MTRRFDAYLGDRARLGGPEAVGSGAGWPSVLALGGFSRPPWFALGVAVESGALASWARGLRGAGLMSAGDVDELSIILRPRKRWGRRRRAERTRFYPDDKARSIRQWEISWSDKMPMGEKMTSLDQCDHAEVELKRDEGRKRSGRLWALQQREGRRCTETIGCRTVSLLVGISLDLQVASCGSY